MRTSVVMVSYFTGSTLRDAVASVLEQPEPVELLLVDNGNPPGALETLPPDPRLRVLSGHGNIGFGAGCNLGARAATGHRLLLLNPDGVLPADALARLAAHAAPLAGEWMIGPRLLDAAGRDQAGSRRALLTPRTALVEALGLGPMLPEARLNWHDRPLPAGLTPVPCISGACMYLPLESFRRLGGFDEDYFLHVEDIDLCLRFGRAGGRILFAPDVVVTHVGGTSAASSAFVERQKARSFRRYFEKHFADAPWPLRAALDAAIIARLGLKLLLSR